MYKRIVCLSCLVFLFIATVSFGESKRNLASDDRFALKELSQPQLSPDAKWIAYVVKSFHLKDDKTNNDIYMVSVSGGDPIQLTSDEKDDNHPRWSPDNRYLAFLSGRKKKSQVYLLNRNGGEALQLTDIKQGVSDFAWSPDSKKLALILTDPDPYEVDEEEDKDKDKDGKEKTKRPIVVTRLQIKTDTKGYLNDLRDHIYAFDIATKQFKQLTSGPHDDSNIRWSPDGRQILFVSNRTENPDANRNSDLFLVSSNGGDPKKLTTNPGSDSDAEWSSDGKWIVYQTTVQPDLIWYDTAELAVIPSSGGEPKILTRELDRNIGQPGFAPDQRQIFFILEDQGTERIASVPVTGANVNRNVAGENVVTAYDISSDGTIAFLATKPALPAELFIHKNGQTQQLTHMNTGLLDQIRLGKVERAKFKSKDGTPVEAFVTFPPNFDRSKKYPLILWIHGGPTSQYSESFDFTQQLFAANGYVVLAVNPRGSTGYGEEFCKAIWADWGNKDYDDVIAGVDHLIAQGYVDPNRLGVGGWSYGGMLTDYVITKSGNRFKAAASGASEANYLANYGTDHYQYEWEKEIGLPWEKEELYRKISPFSNVHKVVTPTLFMCGEIDWNVPLLNSEQLYQSLRRIGIDTMLVIYPDQSHSIQTPSYLKDRYDRYLAWFGHYLKGEKNKVPPEKKLESMKAGS